MKPMIIATVMVVATVTSASAQYGTSRDSSYGGSSYGGAFGAGTAPTPRNYSTLPYTDPQGNYIGGRDRLNPYPTHPDSYITRSQAYPYPVQPGTRSSPY